MLRRRNRQQQYGRKNTIAIQVVKEPLRSDHTSPTQQIIAQGGFSSGAHPVRHICVVENHNDVKVRKGDLGAVKTGDRNTQVRTMPTVLDRLAYRVVSRGISST